MTTPIDSWSRRTATIVIRCAVVVGLLAFGTLLLLGARLLQQYPAKISEPAEIDGLHRLDVSTTDSSLTTIRERVNPTLADFYSNGNGRYVLVMTRIAFLPLPAKSLDASLAAAQAAAQESGTAVEVDPGDLGGVAKCAYAKIETDPGAVVCGWADHGSVAIMIVGGAQDRDEAARMMLDVRAAVESH